MKSDNDFRDKVFQRNDNIVARKIADEMILVPIRGNLADMQRIFSLTPVAEFIWERLDGARSVKEIRADLIQSFEVDRETAEKDISEFIDELIDNKLIRSCFKTSDQVQGQGADR